MIDDSSGFDGRFAPIINIYSVIYIAYLTIIEFDFLLYFYQIIIIIIIYSMLFCTSNVIYDLIGGTMMNI